MTTINSTTEKTGGIQYWHKIVVLLCLGWTVMWIYRPVLTAIFPEVQQTIGPQSNTELGLIASCYFFAYTAMQIPAGMLVDRFGKKAVVIPGFLLFTIAALIIGNAHSIMMIYIGSLLAGLGCGSYYGAAWSLSAENIPSAHRGFASAIINTGSALGMGISLLATSFLVKSWGMPWEYMLYIIAALLLCLVAGFAIIIKENPKLKAAANNETKAQQTINEPEATTQKHSFFSPQMIASYIMYFATCYGYYMIVSWLPNFLETERGFTGGSIGSASSLVAFAAIPGALIISKISDKFRDKRLIFIIALELIAAATLFTTVQSATITFLLAGLIFYGLFGKLTVEPILISHVAETAPKTNYGTSFGVFNFFGMSSSVIAPPLTGYLADLTGTKITGFYVAIGILIVATVIFFLINMRQSTNNK
ncbi:MFS transporter [Gilliamella sp. B2923]|uniref:MFS transporter n=1 Tax=Gilliamella sp. B2923 TaxID=2818005 RepID=UPI00226A07D5|nr:MFS transporter [Gilliamella sp. B2923]MCX8618240.1 MFS transporter [Gilliamella sp. B2923]